MISSWSPAAYLKSDANTVNGTLAKDANGNYKYDEFAQWWFDSLNAYEANGITADYVNMQNEPDCLPNWDSCRFRPTETEDWAGYNLAFDALARKLNTMPNPPKLLAPETCNISRELNNHYLDFIIDSNQLYGYAHHLYGDGNSLNPDSYIPNMTNFAELHNDKPILQTEYHFGREDFQAAIDLAHIMHNSLTIEQVSAYLHWELFWEGKGLVSLDWPWGTDPGYTINPIYYAFKHYSAFIHSGWRRIDAAVDSDNPKVSAYISPDNKQLSVVIINTSADTNVAFDLSFDNFTVADGNVFRTSSIQNCELLGDFNDSAPLTLPARSITTLALSGTLILTDCQQVQDLGLALTADLDGNCRIDYNDLKVITGQWMSTNPAAIPPNYSPDVQKDGIINLYDLNRFSLEWLQCNNPADSNCLQNW
jgi:glucuronoarabinoxylan endo-1,4-beta-xylanase